MGEQNNVTEFDSDLCSGKLTRYNSALLGFSPEEFENICEGWGSEYCKGCSFQQFIPETCPEMCELCGLVCPCNRTYRYEDVRKQVMIAEYDRIQGET